MSNLNFQPLSVIQISLVTISIIPVNFQSFQLFRSFQSLFQSFQPFQSFNFYILNKIVEKKRFRFRFNQTMKPCIFFRFELNDHTPEMPHFGDVFQKLSCNFFFWGRSIFPRILQGNPSSIAINSSYFRRTHVIITNCDNSRTNLCRQLNNCLRPWQSNDVWRNCRIIDRRYKSRSFANQNKNKKSNYRRKTLE